MKALKILLKVILGIVVLFIVALLALPLWFGPVVKSVANAVAPKVVKAGFHLGHLSLNPYTARFELGDFQLSNPEGYSEQYAATLGSMSFDAETASLASDVIHVEEIVLKDVFVSYLDGGADKANNFDQIQYNIAGGKDKYEAAQAAKKAAGAVQPTGPKGAQDASGTSERASKKVIIDHLVISGIKIKYGLLPAVSVPLDLKLDDIGKKSNGATLEEAWQQILDSVLRATGSLSDQVKALGGLAGDATERAAKATEKAAKALDNAAKAAGDAAKALDSIKKLW